MIVHPAQYGLVSGGGGEGIAPRRRECAVMLRRSRVVRPGIAFAASETAPDALVLLLLARPRPTTVHAG